MLKVVDEKNKINLECDSLYAMVLNEENGTRFLSNVDNGNALVSVIGGFLCGAVNTSISAGLSVNSSRALFEGILKQVFDNVDFIRENTEKQQGGSDDKKE